MRRSATVLALLLALTTPAILSAAEDAPQGPGFEQFKLILERNIFDPDRTKPVSREERRQREVRPARSEFLSLNGTIRYQGKAFAFFDGSDSDYKGAVGVGEAVAGLNIVEITSKVITLDQDGKPLEVRVGEQLRREPSQPWALATGSVRLSSSGSSESAEGAKSDEEASVDTGEMSDVLKRMMEKRRKELE